MTSSESTYSDETTSPLTAGILLFLCLIPSGDSSSKCSCVSLHKTLYKNRMSILIMDSCQCNLQKLSNHAVNVHEKGPSKIFV